MNVWVYLDGKLVPGNQAKISALDLSILRGYGVNDFLRTYGGTFFRLKDHVIRFQRSAEEVGLTLPKSKEEIVTIANEMRTHLSLPEISLKLMLTGGVSPDQYLPADNPTFFAVAYPFVPFPDVYFQRGIKIITECYSRPIPSAKSIHYLPAIVAMQRAKKVGAVDVLFHTQEGVLLETGTANFFAIRNGKIITPASQILRGITRQIVLGLAQKIFPVEERALHLEEIPSFDGAFLTSTNKEVMPVSHINEHTLPIPQQIRTLMEDFTQFVRASSRNS